MRRSYRSHLTAMFREAEAARRESAASGRPIDEVTQERALRARLQAEGRREFLCKSATIAVAAALGSVVPRRAWSATAKRIVITGGGLAGLRCAHKLWVDRGMASTVYEWDDHVGGRVETLRNYFANGQIAEMHGEFISSEHASMLALATRFKLALDNTNVYPTGTSDTYWFLGGRYTQAQLNADWQSFGWKLFNSAIKAAPWRQSYKKYTTAGYNYDHMSVIDWINAYVPNGMNAPFGKLCAADVEGEYGSPANQESALNLIYILGYDDSAGGKGLQPKSSPVLAGTDEKWHITGGNDQIVTGMVKELPAGTIELGQKLVAIVKNSNGTYNCTFNNGSANHDVVADAVVLAIPFSTLRQVDLTKAGISALKMTAINSLGYGTDSKILLQFNTRPWNTGGYTGNSLEDTLAAQTWETTNYQAGPQGMMLSFPGGAAGAGLASKYGLTTDQGPAPALMVSDLLASLEQVFPGCTAAYNGKAYYNTGVIDPHILGAWSNYLIGQYTLFSGVEPLAEGNIQFAGEHTSLNFQGFMEGAVAEGERVAGAL
jgi:monoamine oxidase